MPATRIMVVEDERIVALHLRHQLLKLGYEVVFIASTGDQVLRRIESLRPDVVLMDIHIEGDLDGIDTVARLPPELHIPVIYLTAYSEEPILARARATKPFGFLLKPFSERELHATIQMALERRTVEVALRDSEEHLTLALQAAGMGAWEVDAQSRRIIRAGHIEQVFGCGGTGGDASWERFLEHVVEDDRALLLRAYEHLTGGDAALQVEFRGIHADGSVRWLRAQGKSIPPRAEHPQRIIGVLQDVSDHKAAEDRRRQALTVFEATRDGLLILDPDLRIVTVNPGYCAITGHDETELLGRRPHMLDDGMQPADLRDEIMAALGEGGRWRGEIQGMHRGGEALPLLMNIAAVRSEHDSVVHYVAAFTDLTAIRAAEQRLQHLAHYDPLTDLPNRLLAADRLDHAMERCRRDRRALAVLFVDLDFFKRINDTLGHSVGDTVLKTVAQRMRGAVRAEDTVARLGGDEFMVILEQAENPDDIAAIAMKIRAAVTQPIMVGGRELATSASIGISLFPDDGQTRESLIQAADTAMYAAKETGRNGYAFYTREMTERVILAASSDREVRRALAEDELVLFYQPQISMETGRLEGMEALIRWRHPVRGLLGPAEIIPAAERGGFIIDIGDWVVAEACRQIRRWRECGLPPIRVAVNVSAQQMRNGRLLRAVEGALAETGISPDSLEIEITESMLQNEEECIATLHALKGLGVTLAIDDFGTGYSCLSSLKSLPIQRLKIDRAFIQGIPGDLNDMAIAEAIIAMAHRLRLSVVAEGVETEAHMEFLRALGCEGVQGFFHARPMPASDVPDFVAGGITDSRAPRRR
ncbi:response regulator receiver modulated diguanylate cyclase/phosphodiesterase with PAS/PAC sensor(s) [Paramagnetospirillum caucaseum]|uniref:Response regulator receiver modulated diguanylate cyclase/phosphodiesterase with PAS/PAC sensor(S) n=1 Tax=Paramagnetospirillum caucaseum TaxID=1244869 RepID=M3AEB0_9PROT|nr:EAL domain-containing protein [Paramagnetospirillum caucaseum]EME70879.1 response regulator receiver modulated diguanylate cyclase/phosphodiesterase with PAS/PAC sensor(s) [Paramagnetospirillum caucaseum]